MTGLRVLAALFMVACISLLANAAHAGSGRFDASTGSWNIIVSLSWEATSAEIDHIEDRFTSASKLLYDITDGAMRFGTVTIFDGGAGKEFSDVDITLGHGGATAPPGSAGIFGVSFHLFTDDDIYASGSDDDTWQTITHEFAHYALGVLDEYGPSGSDVECVTPTPSTACMMDDFKSVAYADASELCWRDNHDPDGDTKQESVHGESCWETLARLYPTINAPANDPEETPPTGFQKPDFEYFDDPLVRVALVLDASGSMNGEGRLSAGISRIEDLQTFASQFIDLMGLDDVELGIVTYSSTASEEQGATLLDDAADVSSSKNNLPNTATGRTSIGRGLIAGRDLLTASPAPGPLVLILMTDGFHNHPPGDVSVEPLTILPTLVEKDIRVHTIGLGDSTNADLLRTIADETGAMFWKAHDSLELEPVFSSLAAVARGGSLLDAPQRPGALGPGEVHVTDGFRDDDRRSNALAAFVAEVAMTRTPKYVGELRRVWVEKGSQEVAFNLGWSSGSAELSLGLGTPSGQFINPGAVSLGKVPGVRAVAGERYASYVVENAEEGWWEIAVVPRRNPEGTAYAIQPTVLNVAVTGYADGDLITSGPEPVIRIVGMARDGIAVTNAAVTAMMIDPGGESRLVQMFDDGNPTHGDDFAADGLYSALVDNLAASGNGIYHFDVTFDVDPRTATVVPGEEPPPTVDNRTIYSVRRFRRSFPVDVSVEVFPSDSGDRDDDGIPNREDGYQDMDGDGRPNYRDRDSDGDDHADRDEGTDDLDCDGVPNFMDRDSDGDGLDDTRDPAPFERTRSGPCERFDPYACCIGLLVALVFGVLLGFLACRLLRRRAA